MFRLIKRTFIIKSVVQDEFGGPDVLKIGTRKLAKRPDANSIRIKIHYTALNRADLLQREGKYPNQKSIMNMGLECSGEVYSIGERVKEFSIGDSVMSLLDVGGYAEYVDVNANFAMKIDGIMPMKEAAGVPETFLTAYQLLHFVGQVENNSKILIHGAGSGVGTSAIQLARLTNSELFATAGSEKKLRIAENLGAHHLINYKEESFGKKFKNIDFILDCVGGSFWKENIRVLAMDGKWILYGLLGGVNVDGPLLGMLLSKRAQIRASTLMSRSEVYKSNLVSTFWKDHKNDFISKNLRPVLDSTFSIQNIAEAQRYMSTDQNCGKILLKIDF